MDEIQKVNTSLANYGGREPVKEMALRVQTMMPNAQRLQTAEAMAVAQLAFAHDLDPFNGEVWGIKSADGKWYGVMVGIKGLRKSARREARKGNSDFFVSFVKVEPKKYDFAAGDVVYECHLRDVASFQAWSKMYTAMKAAGVDTGTIEAAVGPAPVVIGVGKANASERSKMELHARAKKRAEADALKQKYDLNFGGTAVTEGENAAVEISEIVEQSETGEYTDAEAQDIPATEPAEVTAEEIAYAEACEAMDFKGMKYSKKTDAELAVIRDNAEAPDIKREAAKTILAWRASHSTEAKNLAELGF